MSPTSDAEALTEALIAPRREKLTQYGKGVAREIWSIGLLGAWLHVARRKLFVANLLICVCQSYSCISKIGQHTV